MYLSFMHNYGYDYGKAREIYLGSNKVERIEEVIRVNYDLRYTADERRTNIPYLNQPNSHISNVLHGISHDKLI